MAGHSAIGVDDDLAAGQSAVSHGSAGDEASGGVDVKTGLRTQPLLRYDRLDDVLHHRFPQIGQGNAECLQFGVLGRQHDRFHGDGPVILVPERHLAFRIGAQPGPRPGLEHAGLADSGLLLHQQVRIDDRRRHQCIGLVARVTEHEALVAGALVLRPLSVDALCDIGRLLAQFVDHGARVAVETELGTVVTDVGHRLADNSFHIHVGTRRNLPGHHDETCLGQRLTGYPAVDVILKNRIQHGIGDLVAHLVRVAFGHGFGGKQVIRHFSGSRGIVYDYG